ncbi:hypothetical protein [Chitinophaga nivalis]|uniref:Uncharacterized protein n=1 Tax=Chitinophaga nivalis TaxID=2991709 RepID=A0ABT3III4_9BACT|nr:hypothetical protein [Chitinophaga nivalis]MCW3466524.1 hypothetical protein [Chitinophaga nivalis]MCW3483785.1 hypothetical protein [Chitinophaga nivalis]
MIYYQPGVVALGFLFLSRLDKKPGGNHKNELLFALRRPDWISVLGIMQVLLSITYHSVFVPACSALWPTVPATTAAGGNPGLFSLLKQLSAYHPDSNRRIWLPLPYPFSAAGIEPDQWAYFPSH